MDILSVDIDLNRHHMWSNRDGRVAYNATSINEEALMSHDVVLVEVASNVFYIPPAAKRNGGEKGVIVRKTAWMIYNTYLCTVMYNIWKSKSIIVNSKFLVSPSHDWTKKYDEETRQRMAGVSGQDNHDIRECRTMQYFYQVYPKPWVDFHTYFNSFSFKDTK